MLVCNYFFFSFLLRFLFYGTRRGVNGALFWGSGCFGRGGFYFRRGGFVYIGVVLFTSGRFRLHRGGFVLHRGGFVYIGVVLFSSGRQNGDMWHRYDAVLQQIAVMKQSMSSPLWLLILAYKF